MNTCSVAREIGQLARASQYLNAAIKAAHAAGPHARLLVDELLHAKMTAARHLADWAMRQ